MCASAKARIVAINVYVLVILCIGPFYKYYNSKTSGCSKRRLRQTVFSSISKKNLDMSTCIMTMILFSLKYSNVEISLSIKEIVNL